MDTPQLNMSPYQFHCKAYKNTHSISHETCLTWLVGTAACGPMRKLGTEEGDGCSLMGGDPKTFCLNISLSQSKVNWKQQLLKLWQTSPITHIESPQYPADHRGQKALAQRRPITTCHRRWSSPSWLSVWWAAWTPAAPRSWWTCWCPLSFHKCICSLWTISV